jgi:hypothetical protein
VEKSHIDRDENRAPLDFALNQAAIARTVGVAAAWEEAHAFLRSEPPLRLHLLHQIMLI